MDVSAEKKHAFFGSRQTTRGSIMDMPPVRLCIYCRELERTDLPCATLESHLARRTFHRSFGIRAGDP